MEHGVSGDPAADVDDEPRRAWIAVSRLPYGSRVEEPLPRPDGDLGPSGRMTAAEVAVVESDGQRNMTVAYEDESRRRTLQRRSRGILCEHVFPHGIAGARVVQIGVSLVRIWLEPSEEPTRGCVEGTRRPHSGGRRVGVEVARLNYLPEREEIVISGEARRGAGLDERAAVVRSRAVTDGVAKAPDRINTLVCDCFEHPFEGADVTVDVGDDGNAQA